MHSAATANDQVICTADRVVVRDGGPLFAALCGSLFVVAFGLAGYSVGAAIWFWLIILLMVATLVCLALTRRTITARPGEIEIDHHLGPLHWRKKIATVFVSVKMKGRGTDGPTPILMAMGREVMYLPPAGWTLERLADKMTEVLSRPVG
jgi:hypothetical protein